jgi:nucleotide-binding universal stress UspA family protein
LDYDAVPVGGSYWFNGQLQKRYWAAPTPTPETPEPIVEFTQKRAVDIEDAASGLTYQVRFKRILVPTDFSESAEQALKYAVRFNDLYHAEIFLLHVFTLPEYVSPLSAKAKVDSEVADDVWEAAKKRALEKLEDIVRRLADKKPALITSLSIGCPFEEIVKFSAERNVDLIVMSTHGRTLRPEVFPDHLYYDLYARFAALRTGYQLGFFDSSANYPGCRRRRSATGLPSRHVGNFPSRETWSRNGSLRYGSDSGSHTWAYPGGMAYGRLFLALGFLHQYSGWHCRDLDVSPVSRGSSVLEERAGGEI